MILVTGLDSDTVIFHAGNEITLIILAQAQVQPIEKLAFDLERETQALIKRGQRLGDALLIEICRL